MGEPEDDDDVPEHYFCEECRPGEHKETVRALERGEPIWEGRNKAYRAWKKMSANRRKSRGKGEEGPPWLKKEVKEEAGEGGEEEDEEEGGVEVAGAKRKRDSSAPAKAESAGATPAAEEPSKRRKSVQPPKSVALDPETAVVEISTLPTDRKPIAEALAKLLATDIGDRVKKGSFQIPDKFTVHSLAERYASLIEYALFMHHGSPSAEGYKTQFRQLLANMKRNKMLIERLLDGSLTPDELAKMESKDMASEEQQVLMRKWKEEADRQAVLVEPEGPKFRHDHKGIEKIEDDRAGVDGGGAEAQPVRERTSVAEDDEAEPTFASRRQSTGVHNISTAEPRRSSSQAQFDMNNIWSKTAGSAQSPTTATRPMQKPPRRRSSVPHDPPQAADGTKEDADVDRLLQDDEDEDYEPGADGSIIWRGKLIHVGEGSPMVNARFVAGRDLSIATAPWRDILPSKLTVDGRLAIAKAEEYLCNLQWSQHSDVSVLLLSPSGTEEGDQEQFDRVFEYFASRGRYAVVNADKPKLVKDLYIIPVEKRAQKLPEHVGLLEHCEVKVPVEERGLLVSMVVSSNRAAVQQQQQQQGQQPGQQGMPQHLRVGSLGGGNNGPSGSPIAAQTPTFSPGQGQQQQQQQPPAAGYGAPPQGTFPPNPYMVQQQQQHQQQMAQMQPQHQHPNPLVASILGPRQWDRTALQVVEAQPDIDEQKLRNLRRILEEDVRTRDDLGALAGRLNGV